MLVNFINEALPGVLGNSGTRAFISGEQGNTGQILRGTGEQRQYWGTGNIKSKFSIYGEQGNKPIYFRGTREQVPPWEGLINILNIQLFWFPAGQGLKKGDFCTFLKGR